MRMWIESVGASKIWDFVYFIGFGAKNEKIFDTSLNAQLLIYKGRGPEKNVKILVKIGQNLISSGHWDQYITLH